MSVPGACFRARSIGIGTDRNEHSLVLCLDYGVFHMLLTGDMMQTEKNDCAGVGGCAENRQIGTDGGSHAKQMKSGY